MLNSKKLETNSNVPAYQQAGNLQTNSKPRIFNHRNKLRNLIFKIWSLELGDYLVIGAWKLVILKFKLYY
jgi:hypothetical protein